MPEKRKVLLVGWDAADWKVITPLMDAGRMPNVQRLVEAGSMAQIATLNPPLSPMLWTSIATGKRPFKHGIHGFSEPTADGQGVQPVTNLSRSTKALWNILNQNGLRSTVIGWWPSHPAEPISGVTVSDHFHRARGAVEIKTEDGVKSQPWPLLPGTIHPPELTETLAALRLHPQELSQDMVKFFVPKALEIDDSKDRRMMGLMRTLCECVSMHSAATWLIENRPWDLFAVYYDAIDHFCHGFMRYHPPRQEFISENDFDYYQNVVTAGYLFHDMMLGTLLQKAGPDTTVILMSDHGFHPDHLRPRAIPDIPAGPAIEHRDFGIFAISGPGIKRDELLHGVSVLDVTPTILSLFGLPTGADMDGKVLTEAFEDRAQDDAPQLNVIPSWDEVAGEDGRHPPHTRLDPVAASESLQQLVALGYIEKPDEDKTKAVANTIKELRYNLGEAWQDAARHGEALEIFRELYRDDPDEQRFAVHLFVSCQALGRKEEMRAIVADLDGRRREVAAAARTGLQEFRGIGEERQKERQAAGKESPDPELEISGEAEAEAEADAAKPKPEPIFSKEENAEIARLRGKARYQPAVVAFLKAEMLTADRRWREALEALGQITEANMVRPGLFIQTAILYGRLTQWEDAERIYGKALAIDPDNPHAHAGFCRIALHRRDYAAAAQAALDSIQRLYQNPVVHFLLGVALVGMRQFDRATDAFRVALRLNPNYPQAHLWLARISRRWLNDPEAADEHLHLFRELRRRRPAEPDSVQGVAVEAAPSVSSLATHRASDKPLDDELIVVSGLPRSGTSMIMQMLAAGGIPILSDGLREADEDNPRGYFEFEPVKALFSDSKWLAESKGKAVKIVGPLLGAIPRGVSCRVIWIDRDLDEVLDSQEKMLERKGEPVNGSLDRREMLKSEYARSVARCRHWLTNRAGTSFLVLNRAAVLSDPAASAASLSAFLDRRGSAERMAAAVDQSLHRNRR